MKITIPTPCHENWDAMTPEEKGRFCAVCSKTVRDFTMSSDNEILDVFSNTTDQDICGNFNESQLNKDLRYSYINSLFAKFAVGFVITTGGFVSVNAQQQCDPKEQKEVVEHRMRGKVAPVPVKKDTIEEPVVMIGMVSAEPMRVKIHKPLYVLDGTIINEKKFKAIDQNSIESMNVLKGESATAVFGRKGKYGAIVITSKKEPSK